MIPRHPGRALQVAGQLTILPAAVRLVEALPVQAEDLPAEAVVDRVAVVEAAVVVAEDRTVVAGAEAAAAITKARSHSPWRSSGQSLRISLSGSGRRRAS